REALERGRNKAAHFREYVLHRLSPSLQQVWDKLTQFEKAKDGAALAQSLLERQGTYARRALFIHALIACNFNVSAASRRMGISHNLYYQWLRDDEAFAELVREIRCHIGDFFEAALVELVDRREPSVVIFANKTFNRDRGYGDKPPEGPRVDPSVLDLDS